MRHDAPDSEAVGYGKPPRQTRFKKGLSGNPAGRPKGALNVATTLARILKEPVVVQEHGRRRTITKFEAAATQLVNKAASGDARALTLLLNLLPTLESRWETDDRVTQALPEVDRQILTRLLGRVRRVVQPPADGDHER